MTDMLITCEHGGNQVPTEFQSLFSTAGASQALYSHRGYDPGALDAANQFAKALHAELIASETTRLLVDLNRSQDNPQLYSRFTSILSDGAKAKLLSNWYLPYRQRVENELYRQIASVGRVVHLSIHTFTPKFHGQWRPIDVGLLFDPDRSTEKEFCDTWQSQINHQRPRLRVIANQPYAGTDDGFTTALRRKFPNANYAGIEVEINHRYWKRSAKSQQSVVKTLLDAIVDLLS
ncbi:MAG: N-formylglutamate amidohydrolase [Pirellulaceae bacterium]